MQPDDFRVQVGLYERMADLLRRLGDVPPGTRVLLQVPPRALALRTLDDARLLRERQSQQQIDLLIASTDASILAQARSYGFPVEDLRVQRRGGGPGGGPGLAQGMFRGLGQPGQAPAPDPPSRPAPPVPPPARDPGPAERTPDPFRGLETAGRPPDFQGEPPASKEAPAPPPTLSPSPAPEPPPVPPRATSPGTGRATPRPRNTRRAAPPDLPTYPFRGLEPAGHALGYRPAPPPYTPPEEYSPPAAPAESAPALDPGPTRAPAADAALSPPQAAPPVANPVAPAPPDNAPPVQSPPGAIAPGAAPAAAAPLPSRAVPPVRPPARDTAPAPTAPPVGEAPPAPPVTPAPAPALPAISAAPATETPQPAPSVPPSPRTPRGSRRAAVPAPPAPPVAARPAPTTPPVPEAPAPVPPAPPAPKGASKEAPAPESAPARLRFGLGALRDAIATRLTRESSPAPSTEYAAPAEAAPVAPPAAPPLSAGRTPVRLPPDFAIEASRRAGSAPRGVEFSTALDREEPVEELLERLEHVKSGTTIRLHVPREALALQTLEEYDMLEALQERRQLRLAVVSSNATVVGMAWLYGFEVSDLRSPRPPGGPAPAPLPDEYIVDVGRQERTADLLRRLDGIPAEAKIEIHVPREGAALRTPEDYQLFRAARDWQPDQVRITSRDPRVIDLARIYDFDGEHTLDIGPQETTAYVLKWLAGLPPGAACRLRVHRDTSALRRPADYKLLRSRQVAGSLQLTVVSRDLRVLGLATVHGLAVDNLRLRHRIPVGTPPAARRPGEIPEEPASAPAPLAQGAPAVAAAQAAPSGPSVPAVVPPAARRADAAPPAPADLSLAPDEAQICAYLRNHDAITRGQCERLLGVSRTQAKMRLQKMRERGILRLEGTGNNIRYVLATERRRRAR